MVKKFLSGNEAFAYGVCLAKPHVISAYPITPQTTVVEKLSEMDVKCTPQALLNYFNEKCIGLYEEKKILQACIDAGCGSYVMELAENGIILKRWMR